jgi:DNA-binding transcriptional MerR regulator
LRKDKPIAKAAHAADCSEGQLRRLDRQGVIHPARDAWGRRLFGDDDIAAARAHLTRQSADEPTDLRVHQGGDAR